MRKNLVQFINETLSTADYFIMLAEQGTAPAPLFGGATGTALFNNQDFLVMLWMTIWQTEQFGSNGNASANFMEYINNSTNGGHDIGPANINIAVFLDAMRLDGADRNDPELIAQWREMATSPAGSLQLMIGYFTRYAFRYIPANATPQQVMEACYAVWMRGPKGRRSPTWGEVADQGMENMNANLQQFLTLYQSGQLNIQSILESYEGLGAFISGYINNQTQGTPKPIQTPGPAQQALPGISQHTVVSGDTLSRIANAYGITVQQLLQMNPTIVNPNEIQVGQIIVIPGGG